MKYLFVILTVLTTYSHSTFVTQSYVDVARPIEDANPYIDSLVYDFQTNPDRLFSWAFKGTGKQDEPELSDVDVILKQENSKNTILLNLQKLEYFPDRKYSKMIFNIDVNDKPRFKNVEVETYVTDTMAGFNRNLRLDFKYGGSLVKIIYCNLHVMPQSPTRCRLEVDTHIKFGWFFNIFITKRMYRNVLEWRVERFMENMKEIIESSPSVSKPDSQPLTAQRSNF